MNRFCIASLDLLSRIVLETMRDGGVDPQAGYCFDAENKNARAVWSLCGPDTIEIRIFSRRPPLRSDLEEAQIALMISPIVAATRVPPRGGELIVWVNASEIMAEESVAWASFVLRDLRDGIAT